MLNLYISFQGKRYKCVSFDGCKMLCIDIDTGATRALEPGPHATAYEFNPWADPQEEADKQSAKDASLKLSEGVVVEKNPKK